MARQNIELPFSVDRMLAQEVPKLFQLADDMHAMASYMNDLRIIAIFGTVLGVVGGIGFLIFKYCHGKKSDGYDVCPAHHQHPSSHNQYYDEETGRGGRGGRPVVHPSAFTQITHHEQRQWPSDRNAKVQDIETKLAIRLPEHTEVGVIRNGDRKDVVANV